MQGGSMNGLQAQMRLTVKLFQELSCQVHNYAVSWCCQHKYKWRLTTVLCIPVLDGVFELGTTEKVEEDLELVQHFKTSSLTIIKPESPAKTGLSETLHLEPRHRLRRIHSLPLSCSSPMQAVPNPNQDDDDDEEEEEEENDEEEGGEEIGSYFSETGRNRNTQTVAVAATEPIELMQLETSEDIRLASPDDASNNLDTYFHMILEPNNSGVHSGLSGFNHLLLSLHLCARVIGWTTPRNQRQFSGRLTVSRLPNQLIQSAFSKWTIDSDNQQFQVAVEGTSQCLLKYILFTIPYLHSQYRNDNSPRHVTPKPAPGSDGGSRRRNIALTCTSGEEATREAERTVHYIKVSERARSLSQEPGRDKRKMRKTVDSTQHVTRETTVEVSIIESDALLELQWGVFVAELRAKVKDSVKGRNPQSYKTEFQTSFEKEQSKKICVLDSCLAPQNTISISHHDKSAQLLCRQPIKDNHPRNQRELENMGREPDDTVPGHFVSLSQILSQIQLLFTCDQQTEAVNNPLASSCILISFLSIQLK
ncbi:hypothetical protein F3Y22_tig00111621pilonHSYRG00269 [Hibiscus syriacus]|uniref:Transcription factor MYC/MYB N-terminal domain-containing protein n=1 Tax=Hibiscus syriacus TaxID=106335 RepID=A0A6A2YIE5_HIBSY|nr:hypothetical protein F3Y22_tig00111621pilonHSYRG00269 [Hibiscus syriacus]